MRLKTRSILVFSTDIKDSKTSHHRNLLFILFIQMCKDKLHGVNGNNGNSNVTRVHAVRKCLLYLMYMYLHISNVMYSLHCRVGARVSEFASAYLGCGHSCFNYLPESYLKMKSTIYVTIYVFSGIYVAPVGI